MTEISPMTREHAIRCVQNVGKSLGYAVAVHGTLLRDVDLIAVPWTDKAVEPERLIKRVVASLPGKILEDDGVEDKPHGRVSVAIHPTVGIHGSDRWYVDLSIMPKVLTKQATERNGGRYE